MLLQSRGQVVMLGRSVVIVGLLLSVLNSKKVNFSHLCEVRSITKENVRLSNPSEGMTTLLIAESTEPKIFLDNFSSISVFSSLKTQCCGSESI